MTGPVAVIDIGSNSMRLVIYDRLARSPVKLLDEQLYPHLGRDIVRTNRLNPDGIGEALQGLGRFRRMSEAFGVTDISVVATAAVREAADGRDFLIQAEQVCGFGMHTISGEEEGRLSALGVLSGIPGATGLIGDLGGGSLELIAVRDGVIGGRTTLPLGPFRLMDIGDYRVKRKDLTAAIGKRLKKLPWLKEQKEQAFYAVGGNWRAIAKAEIQDSQYPLRILQHYSIATKRAIEFSRQLAAMPVDNLQKIIASKKRVALVPYAALVLEQLLVAVKPGRLIFSVQGLRDGIVFDRLPAAQQRLDPLLDACRSIVEEPAKLRALDLLIAWSAPLFSGETAETNRLRQAATLISTIGWAEHPDHRAQIAYERTLFLQAGGLDHADRAFMALAIFARYDGFSDKKEGEAITASIQTLLSAEAYQQALRLGNVLRFAYVLTGGALELLQGTALSIDSGRLYLTVNQESAALISDTIEKRFETLAKLLDAKGIVTVVNGINTPLPQGDGIAVN